METKVRVNRASITLNAKLARQINGSKPKRDKIVRAFKRSEVPKRVQLLIEQEVRNMLEAVLYVFGGGVTGIDGVVGNILGVKLRQPWQPLTPDYIARKASNSFWFESGDLLNYVRSETRPMQAKPVADVTMAAKPGKRGDKYIRVSMKFTLTRIKQPLQSMIVANFLQGKYSKSLSATTASGDLQGYKILVNEALRSFLPDLSEEYGRRLITQLTL